MRRDLPDAPPPARPVAVAVRSLAVVAGTLHVVRMTGDVEDREREGG